MNRWLLFLAIPSLASACECVVQPLCEVMRDAPVVFLGETVSGGLNPEEDAWSGRPTAARLRVLEAFRGIEKDQHEIDIALAFERGMCGAMPYRLGARTLVFLREKQQGSYREGGCSPSEFVEEGSKELELVRRYFAGAPTTVIGTVRQNDSPIMARMQPLEGATIHVAREGSSEEQQFLTAPDGSFEIVGLPPGRYRLWASKPGYERRDDGAASIELAKSGCALTNLSLWTKNSVSGQVITWNGAPVQGARVFLRRRDAPPIKGWGLLERTDEQGRFRFEEIAPGLYDAVVSPFGVRPESPYDAAYQGGVARQEDARPFEIKPESEIEEIQIVLGEKRPTRIVRVEASWPDGSEVRVALSCRDVGDSAPPIPWFRSVYFDRQTPNECRVLQDRPYQIVVKQAMPLNGRRMEDLSVERSFRVEPGAGDVRLQLEISYKDFWPEAR
ncbi:MAG: carboxypeptidase regulatory-like domain-containing protein [Acidobacteria bacterium]|nr:carboxypeptidase regulatory-like domain-containing protein [Acidobacteriota bacterium]